MELKIILTAGAFLLLSACDESKYDLENLVPVEHHKTMYINNASTQELTLYNTGEANKYTISVYKGGSNPELTASVDFNVLSQDAVDSLYSEPEGVSYKVIGTDCYSLDMSHLDFSSEDRYKIVTVSLDVPSVQKAMESAPGSTCVLPLHLYSETDSVNANRNQVFIKIKEVLTPTIGFTTTSLTYIPYTYGFSSDSVDIGFGLDTDNNWDIDCKFIVDKDYVESYNAANGTSFAALPEGNYSFDETMLLPSKAKSANLTVTINGNGLKPGDYMLPVRFSEVSLFEISGNSVYPLVIRVLGVQQDRTNWSIKANTEEATGEGAGNGVAKCLLDGNLSTFWHSQWNGGSIGLPHELLIDTKEEITFTHFGLMQRQHDTYKDIAGGYFMVSSDNVTWTQVGSFKMKQILDTQIFPVTPTKGRYFKVVITQSNRGSNSSMSELYSYGVK